MIGDKWLSIRNDRKKGMSYSEIGRKYNIDRRTAKKYCENHIFIHSLYTFEATLVHLCIQVFMKKVKIRNIISHVTSLPFKIYFTALTSLTTMISTIQIKVICNNLKLSLREATNPRKINLTGVII